MPLKRYQCKWERQGLAGTPRDSTTCSSGWPVVHGGRVQQGLSKAVRTVHAPLGGGTYTYLYLPCGACWAGVHCGAWPVYRRAAYPHPHPCPRTLPHAHLLGPGLKVLEVSAWPW